MNFKELSVATIVSVLVYFILLLMKYDDSASRIISIISGYFVFMEFRFDKLEELIKNKQ